MFDLKTQPTRSHYEKVSDSARTQNTALLLKNQRAYFKLIQGNTPGKYIFVPNTRTNSVNEQVNIYELINQCTLLEYFKNAIKPERRILRESQLEFFCEKYPNLLSFGDSTFFPVVFEDRLTPDFSNLKFYEVKVHNRKQTIVSHSYDLEKIISQELGCRFVMPPRPLS